MHNEWITYYVDWNKRGILFYFEIPPDLTYFPFNGSSYNPDYGGINLKPLSTDVWMGVNWQYKTICVARRFSEDPS